MKRRHPWKNALAGVGFAFVLVPAAFAQTRPGTMPSGAVPPESMTDPSVASGVSDSIITARAKAALLGTDKVDSGNVHVTTTRGVVTLTGKVADDDEKSRAEQAVQDLDGVVTVNNRLETGAAAR